MDSYKVVLHPEAEDELRLVPFPFRREVAHAIGHLRRMPRPPRSEIIEGDVYRLLVHGWRVVYEIDEAARTVTIFRVTH